MRFLTINVHGWQEENQLEKIKQLAAAIHMNRYDAIALQEVSQHRDADITAGNIRVDNYGLLLNHELVKLGSTDYDLFWDVSHYGFEVYEEGLALLVRHPNKKVESFYITDSTSIDNWKSRKIVGGTWMVNGQPLSIYTCHLGWWEDKDEDYKAKVDRLMKKSEADHQPVLLLGDFNVADHIKNEGYDYLLGKGLYDTHQLADHQFGESTITGDIAGWAGNKNDLKIDFIFANWQADVKESRIVFNGIDGPVISDHFGIEVILK
jgi:maltose 6'-phosphate phosphatase